MDDTFVDGMDERFSAALSNVTAGYGLGVLLTERFAPAMGAVALAIVFASCFSLIVDLEKETAGAIRGLCVGFATLAACICATVVAGRRRRTATRAVTPYARIALEGIRIGSIRYLSRHHYECLAMTVGERVVAEAIQSSPREVTVI